MLSVLPPNLALVWERDPDAELWFPLPLSSSVAPHLTVERANSAIQRLPFGISRGFRTTSARHWGPKRAVRTTFRPTTV